MIKDKDDKIVDEVVVDIEIVIIVAVEAAVMNKKKTKIERREVNIIGMMEDVIVKEAIVRTVLILIVIIAASMDTTQDIIDLRGR
jgi:hypothetical protein